MILGRGMTKPIYVICLQQNADQSAHRHSQISIFAIEAVLTNTHIMFLWRTLENNYLTEEQIGGYLMITEG